MSLNIFFDPPCIDSSKGLYKLYDFLDCVLIAITHIVNYTINFFHHNTSQYGSAHDLSTKLEQSAELACNILVRISSRSLKKTYNIN